MKIIDLEAHFITAEFSEYVKDIIPLPSDSKLHDLGEGRIKDMDESGIHMQVISLFQPPHIQRLDVPDAIKWAKSTNNELSLAVKKYPDRFVGLAAIPIQSPPDGEDEMKRAVLELGLKGICLVSNAREEYFDDKKYWGIFETAENLDIPIYLHPIQPSDRMAGVYAGYPTLMGPPHGLHTEVSLHVMRLIYSGLFDRYPKLRMILGHMGEGLPFWFPRMDFSWHSSAMPKPEIAKKPSDYIKQNFTVTTSGMFFQPALMCTYLAMGADKIAFAVDYPPEDNTKAVEFIKSAPISDPDKEKICHSNAESIFKLE